MQVAMDEYQQGRSHSREEGLGNGAELALAYKDQGFHEMEFSDADESLLHEKLTNCQKNPGHKTFISVKEFTIEHMPEGWQETLAFDYIKSAIFLTVRLAVGYTSKDRPPNYPLHNRRGKANLTAFGSGWIKKVDREFATEDGDICPCQTCRQAPENAKKHWGQFQVYTARHVVYDSTEASHTKCNLFFDCDKDRYSCPSLEGVEVTDCHTKSDYTQMKCVTHDKDVSMKLEDMVGRNEDLRKQLDDKYEGYEHVDKESVVIPSHPHGGSKHVTIGDITGTPLVTCPKWIYSAETCPGSSGAPVCILGKWDEMEGVNLYTAAHSGCQQKGQNESGPWCLY